VKKSTVLLWVVFSLQLIPTNLWAFGDSFDVDSVYIEMDTGMDNYFAQISSGFSDQVGEVKKLFKKSSMMAIGIGKHKVSLTWIADDFFSIDGSAFVLRVRDASMSSFSGYSQDWILDTSGGFGGTLTAIDRH